MGQFTDAKYAPYVTNTGELSVDAAYIINEVNRN
jgi:hypothetical protein